MAAGTTPGDAGGRAEGLHAGTWLPPMVGGHPRRWRRVAAIAGAVVATLVVVAAVTVYALVHVAESNIDRLDVAGLASPGGEDGVLNVLVVGSDSREGLTDEQIREYDLGTFSGERGDTVLLVSIVAESGHVNVVSFPRDLYVVDDGEPRKLTETFADGPGNVVDVLEDNTGVPIHHYVEVSIPGFISVVDAVGGVQMCLEEPLEDDKSGADFAAGCQHFSPPDALAYVRSRGTARGDFDRMDRQQKFLKALVDRLVDTDILVNVPRLFSVVERVARNVTTDQGLGVGEMRRLAVELRGLAAGDLPMVTVPSYTARVAGRSYVVPYEPGARAIYAALQAGEPLRDRGPRDERADTRVAVWTGGRATEADLVKRTLFWSGFNAYVNGPGPLKAPADVDVVFANPGHGQRAQWVAATLGGEVADTPPDVELPESADVVVVPAERSIADLDRPGEVHPTRTPGAEDAGADDEAPDETATTSPSPDSSPSPTATASPSPSPTPSPTSSPTPSPSPSEPSEPAPVPTVTTPGSEGDGSGGGDDGPDGGDSDGDGSGSADGGSADDGSAGGDGGDDDGETASSNAAELEMIT